MSKQFVSSHSFPERTSCWCCGRVSSQLLPTSVTCSFRGLSTGASHAVFGSGVFSGTPEPRRMSAGSLYCSLMALQLRDAGKNKSKRLLLL